MLQITLDLGNVPSVLAVFNAQTVQKAVNAAAESYNDDVHDWIDAGHGFFTHRAEVRDDRGKVVVRASGHLQQSTNWYPSGNGTATVYSNTDYARYVEEGTRAHVIRSRDRKALRFPTGSGAGFGFVKVINHPGSKPHPFFFADFDNRVQRMQERALSVLAHVMEQANG